MPETAGEYVDIPALLKGILNGYPGNSAIFREYLQNSDDANASSQIFILDERTYPSESLVDSSLVDSQGPALVAVNDGVLEDTDWTSLQMIHSSSKALDESRTGKNGLGFRASYHLTENPHLLSGSRLVILDAHRRFKPHAGGVSMDFIREGPKYPDQLSPFASFINNPASPYPGTIFRLPLRTENLAKTSRIKDTATPVAEMLELLDKFCSDEAEEVILFLKYIKKIEVKHLQRDGSEIRVGMVEVEDTEKRGDSTTVYRRITITSRDGSKSTRVWCHHRFMTSREKALEIMGGRLGYDMGSKLQAEKLSPLVELAFPLTGPAVEGRLYTLLPLPISTGFPLHLNAVFALTPDRQSLKNSLEVGGKKSRERLLVEWNRAVFELWAPAAWAEHLVDLTRADGHESCDLASGWSIWPPQQLDKGKYWAELPNRLVIEILRRRLAVFPSVEQNNLPVSYVSLQDPSILLAGPNPGIPLEALASLNIDIVRPPPYLFSIIAPLISSFKASILSPQALYERLLKTYSETNAPPCDEKDIHVITDYLASLTSLPTIQYICCVPWFSCTNNLRVALGSVSKKFVVPLTEEESRIFSSHPRMLTWDCMSRALHAHVSNPANFPILNVSTLKPDDIVTVLNTKFRHLQPQSSEIKETDHQWLIQFWTWMATWSKLDDFFRTSLNKCGDLYVLPTAERSLRKLSSHSFIFRNINAAAVEAWRLLGVHPLHGDLAVHPASMMKPVVEAPRTAGYVPLLIRSCDTKSQTRLSQDALLALQGSLFQGLPTTARFSLSSRESSMLATMQIFKVRSRLGDEQKLGSIRGNAIYVKVDSAFPLPIQPDMDDAIYVDMSDDPTAKFVQLVNAEPPCIQYEVDFLCIAFDHWELQTAEGKDCFIHWMFEHISRVPQDLISRLDKIPFVEVEKMEQRVPPIGLIDPTSALEKLYTEEAGKFPAGVFRGKYLQTMRSLGLLHSSLDAIILKERLDYLSTPTADPHRFRKAMNLLDLLNQFWSPQFKELIVYTRSKPWMPFNLSASSINTLVSPHQCRDQYSGRGKHENPFYYDLALHILPTDVQISSNLFRNALGWLDVIRPEVLVRQFRLTVDLEPNSERNERLMALIHYLGSLHDEHKLSSSVVDDLISVSADRSWIPISKYGEDTVETKFALLSPDVDLKPPFFHIENFHYPAFLEEMGCTIRPKLEILVDELSQIDFQSAKGLASSVCILQEIGDEYPGFEPNSILIPGDNDEGLPLHRVFFRDMNFLNLSGGMIDLIPAHNSISRALAESLGIPFLSTLMLDDDSAGGQDNHEEDEQMSEDFVNRIQGFLREYDVRYALNEFLANADDAQASRFKLLLDTPTNVGERFVSPAFQKLAGCSRLVLFNDATFSEADFKGLRHVGLGGKRGLANTHGRHGLGALSFYYFTDVVTIISGEHVMFLDPSGEYLPPLRHGKRTALKRTISQVVRQFPDQLKGYESLFEFGVGSTFYDGTLFILPLKSSISKTPCTLIDVHDMIKTSYKALSANAFFFTHLRHISASESTDLDSGDHCLWSFSATRQSVVALDDRSTRHNLTIKHQIGAADAMSEKWLITTVTNIEIPEIHQPTAHGLNLSPESPLCVQLAVRMDNTDSLGLTANSFLFSTLRLPKSTSLPFHINTRFAISSNRQSVMLLPAGSDNQLDPKSAYNIWILKELVPPLYLSTLGYLVHSAQKKYFYRDIWWLLNSEDDISKLVRSSFLDALSTSKKMLFQDGTRNWLPFCDAVFSAFQPSQVTDLLTFIKAPKFVLYEHLKGMAHHKAAKTVDGQFVKRTLAAAGLKPIQDLYKDKKLDSKGIARIMDYVRKEEDLGRIPLLVLSSGELVEIPDRDKSPVYRPTSPAIAALFSRGRFMAHDYTQESVKRLVDDGTINVWDLTEGQIVSLIRGELNCRTSIAQNEWLDLFWKSYPDLPVRPSLASLEDIEIVQGSSRTLRLTECTSNLVIYQSQRRSIEQPILDILQKFDFEIINLSNHPLLDDYLAPKYMNAVTNILQCMESKGIFNFSVLTEQEKQTLAGWMRDRLGDAVNHWKHSGGKVGTQFLRQVPIWIAQTYERQVLHPASGLKILPPNFLADHVRLYQKPGVVFAPYSYSLIKFMQYLSPHDLPPKAMSPKAIMDFVDIPRRIDLDDVHMMESMKSFVSSMLNLLANEVRHARLQVPDRQGNLQLIDGLYDDEVPLFSTTLSYTEPSSFVHASFRNLHSYLHSLGLHHQVNPITFATCARAVNQALQLHAAGVVERNVLFQMSDAAFEVYQTSLPGMIMIDKGVWSSIDDIGFVRRKDIRRQGATYDVDRYFDEPLPLLLPPSRFVCQSMIAIAWTQRALFYQEPSDEVVALNKTIGIPTANEVVEHLKVLAIRIAPDHDRNNSSLINDLKATYKWLNEHIDDAREALETAANLPLFLNVNNPCADNWNGHWLRAREMVLGLQYDTAGLKRVGRFLQSYDRLLSISGCISLRAFERGSDAVPALDVATTIQDMRTTYNEMRKNRELTDVALVPSADGEAAVNDPELRAHLSFLAATIPFVRRSAQGWSVATTGTITFYGSSFGAKALLDFAYTGDFERPTPAGDVEFATLLTNLLELLPIADEWDMPQLKYLLEHKIIHKYDMIQKLPHQYQIMVEQAEKYNAESLKKALSEFQKANEEFLRVLQDTS